MAIYSSSSFFDTVTTATHGFYRLIEAVFISIGLLRDRDVFITLVRAFDEPVYFQATQLYRDMVSINPSYPGPARDFVCRVRAFWLSIAKRQYRDRHYPDCSVVPLGV